MLSAADRTTNLARELLATLNGELLTMPAPTKVLTLTETATIATEISMSRFPIPGYREIDRPSPIGPANQIDSTPPPRWSCLHR
jgi:hypothetical protein